MVRGFNSAAVRDKRQATPAGGFGTVPSGRLSPGRSRARVEPARKSARATSMPASATSSTRLVFLHPDLVILRQLRLLATRSGVRSSSQSCALVQDQVEVTLPPPSSSATPNGRAAFRHREARSRSLHQHRMRWRRC